IPNELAAMYTVIFRGMGLRSIVHVPVATREDADDSGLAAAVDRAKAFFFTGGDQLRIASNLSGSRLHRAIEDLYFRGETVAGTSAGASALGETMPYSLVEDEHRIAAAWNLAPGLGLIRDVVIDQHFAQRGRMGRLVAGVAENPRLLGIGIDEDTALIWRDRRFEVIGAGAIYVVDGRDVTRS